MAGNGAAAAAAAAAAVNNAAAAASAAAGGGAAGAQNTLKPNLHILPPDRSPERFTYLITFVSPAIVPPAILYVFKQMSRSILKFPRLSLQVRQLPPRQLHPWRPAPPPPLLLQQIRLCLYYM